MNKKLWLFVVSLITTIALSACTVGNTSVVFDTDCATGYALEGSVVGHRCVTDAEKKLYQDEVQKFTGVAQTTPETESGGTSEGSEPAATPAPAAAASAPVSGAGQCMTAEEVGSFAATWEEIVYPLDHGVPGKVHHPTGPWMAHAGEFVWLGIDWSPEDITLGGKLQPLQVDGYVGIYYVLQDVEMKGPGASTACIPYLEQMEIKPEVGGQCVDTNMFVAVVNLYRAQGPALINRLDEIIDGNPPYQIRSLQASVFAADDPAVRIVWTREGSVSADDGVPLHTAAGMTVYVLHNGNDVNVGHTWRGICLTRPLNPEEDFKGWWGN